MQVYKGLDHITSSPSSIQESITPHLLHIYVDIEDKYDDVRYITYVKKDINDFSNLGKTNNYNWMKYFLYTFFII